VLLKLVLLALGVITFAEYLYWIFFSRRPIQEEEGPLQCWNDDDHVFSDGWRCQVCGTRSHLEVHHQRFHSRSGEDTDENLIALLPFGRATQVRHKSRYKTTDSVGADLCACSTSA